MKKILVILLFIIANLAIGQSVYTIPKDSITEWRSKATTRNATLAEYENALIYKNIQGSSSTSSATLTAIKKGIDTLNQNERSVRAILNGTTSTSALQSIQINSLTSIYNKLDTLVNSTRYCVGSVTITSTNPATVTVANRVIGNGAYTISLPTGTWTCVGGVMTTSLNMSTAGIKLYAFSGALNVPTLADGNVVDVSVSLSTEFKGAYNCTTGTYNYGQTTGFYSIINNNQLAGGNGEQYVSNFKIIPIYNAAFTPNSSQVYICRFFFKRIN